MRLALQRAQLQPQQIDYLNLHGTATAQNDAVEALAVHALFGEAVPMSSSKPLTGHTLGAAGAIEAALCWLSMRENPRGKLIPHWWDGHVDAKLAPLNLIQAGAQLGRPMRYALSNSFAFGGSNACLIIGKYEPTVVDT